MVSAIAVWNQILYAIKPKDKLHTLLRNDYIRPTAITYQPFGLNKQPKLTIQLRLFVVEVVGICPLGRAALATKFKKKYYSPVFAHSREPTIMRIFFELPSLPTKKDAHRRQFVGGGGGT